MYEIFKSQFTERLADYVDFSNIPYILNQLDLVARDYDFIQKERGLITYNKGTPEILKTFIACKKVEGSSEATLSNYLWILKLFFQSVKKPLDKITSNDVRVFLFNYQIDKNISNRTMDQYQTIIKSFFSWCCDEEYLEKNITRKLNPIKYTRDEKIPLTQMELEVLRKVCETPRDKAIIEFMYSTGCRVSELCNLKFSDIYWNIETVKLLGKGSKYRKSYMNAKCIIALKEYLETRKGDSEYVFVSERAPYDKLIKDGIDKRFRYLSKKANIGRKITPHLLRHTTATTSLQNGMPVTDVQQLLGHSRLDTTMVYAKVSNEQVQNNHKKFVI